MLGIPAQTRYDLRFRLLGIPVRVHPLFWLVTAMMGGVGVHEVSLPHVLIWIGCVFVSILVHEFGHGLTARAFGYAPWIVLQGLFGLCYSEGERQSPKERLAVTAMGPGAGLLFCALTLLVGAVMFRLTMGDVVGLLGFHLGLPVGRPTLRLFEVFLNTQQDRPAALIFWNLVYINFFWSLLNLLPIWPLDGGQIAGVLLTQSNPANGRRWTHILALVTAGSLALLSYMKLEDTFLAIFFAIFALMNFQILNALHQQARYGIPDDEF